MGRRRIHDLRTGYVEALRSAGYGGETCHDPQAREPSMLSGTAMECGATVFGDVQNVNR